MFNSRSHVYVSMSSSIDNTLHVASRYISSLRVFQVGIPFYTSALQMIRGMLSKDLLKTINMSNSYSVLHILLDLEHVADSSFITSSALLSGPTTLFFLTWLNVGYL